MQIVNKEDTAVSATALPGLDKPTANVLGALESWAKQNAAMPSAATEVSHSAVQSLLQTVKEKRASNEIEANRILQPCKAAPDALSGSNVLDASKSAQPAPQTGTTLSSTWANLQKVVVARTPGDLAKQRSLVPMVSKKSMFAGFFSSKTNTFWAMTGETGSFATMAPEVCVDVVHFVRGPGSIT